MNCIAMLDSSANGPESSLLIHEQKKEQHWAGDVVIGNQHPFLSYHKVLFQTASGCPLGGHQTMSQNSYFLVEQNHVG